jgi:FkbM family methyltransferase
MSYVEKRDVITLDKALELARDQLSRGDVRHAYALWENMSSASPGHIATLTLKAELLDITGRSGEAAVVWKQVALLQAHKLSYNNLKHALNLLHNAGFAPHAALDIGAHSGTWTEEFQEVFPHTPSLMVEAQPSAEPVLAGFAKRNPQYIEYRIALLGQESRHATPFFVSENQLSTGASLYLEQTTHQFTQVELPMTRLDDLVKDHPWRPFDVIKLDVQGAEKDILSGSGDLLPDCQVIIAELSLAECNKGGVRINEFISFMNAKDFILFELFGPTRDKNEVLIQIDGVFIHSKSPLCKNGIF